MKSLVPQIRKIAILIILLLLADYVNSQTFVPFKQRLENGGVNLKGDITFIANSIVSKDQDGTSPNDDYHDTEGNGSISLGYVDIDNDPTTFSSSKAQLSLPSCSKVVFAGLYWSAVYPREFWDDENSTRDTEVNTIKFKLPNQNYQDVTGDVIFDGPTITGTSEKIVYTCFKDVTSIVDAQDNVNGDYFAANIKATTRGANRTGSSAGWILVIVYENQTEPSRRISIFDGFIAVKGGRNPENAEASYSGFKTVPTGPVRAKMLVAALEGDKSIEGDDFQFQDVNGDYQSLSTPNTNPIRNFFNGSITIDDQYLPNRQPASENTLGFDADLFSLNNINNQLIANNQEDANIRLTTTQDAYWVFLNALSVEIIEPDIELIKTIEDINGNDIAGAEVTLGNEIWYNVSFRNKGNDDATQTQIIDRLPKNVDLLETELVVPAGVTYTYQAPTLANEFRGELEFTIPDNLVEIGDPAYNIRLKVKVVESCNELRDVCSNIIQNQAFVDYAGVINGVTITNTPSYFGVDACNRGFEGPSNFLADVDDCTYERDEVLCTETVDLTAGAGFLSYTWKDSSGNIIGTTQTITVSQTGRYTVDKVAPVGCISSQEIINVVSFITQPNPIVDFADEVLTCPDDGSLLSEIYLCGSESTKLIETNIFNSNTIIWQKLDESSCTDTSDANCPNTNNSCTWNTVKTGNDFVASEAGSFRVEIRAQGGCFKRYYFNVFQADLNPLVTKEDIICSTNGSITINNIPDNYQFSLTNDITTFQDDNSFVITTAGSYTVYIRKKGGNATSCVYELPVIDVFEKNIDVELTSDPIQCAGDNGIIRVNVNNVDGDFVYQLLKDGNLLSQTSPKSDNNHEFSVSEAGTYTIKVTAPNNCSFEGDIEISKPAPIEFLATTTSNISCVNGRVDFTTSGGTPLYNYAIWSFNGTPLYTNPQSIPFMDFFTDSFKEFTAGEEGVYEFIVVDNNNCYTISNPATVTLENPLTFTQNITNVSCNAGADGSFTINVDGDSQGYSLTYSIDNGANYQNSNSFTNLNSGNYTVQIRATKDDAVCNYQENVTIAQPNEISATATLTQEYTCANEGVITFSNFSGGTTPYKFSIDGTSFFDSSSFTNLTAGTYTPVIKDANNCSKTLPNITIEYLPQAPNFSTTINYSCSGLADVQILPGNASYTYSLNGASPVNTNSFNNLSAGNYSVTVNLGKSCTETVSFTIDDNKAFSGFLSGLNQNTCYNGSDGSFSIHAENFSGAYQYNINNTGWVNTTISPVVINNLASGTYNVKLQKDSCEVDLGSVTISEPDEITVNASVTTEISCTNSGATITPSATGGNAPYEFSIDNGTTWSTVFNNIAAGNYTIIARDSNNCTSSTNASITVNAPESLQFNVTATNCFNGNNGQIQVDVTQGNGGYVFSVNDGPWQSPNVATPTTFTFTGLQANTYKVSVKDALSCEVSEENITINPTLNASIVTNDINCNDGSVVVTATGGDGNYTYAVVNSGVAVTASNFTINNTATITTAGDYDVYVRDKNGANTFCETVNTVTINKIPDLNVSAIVTEPKCFNETGSLVTNISGGEKPYTITVTNTSGFTNTQNNVFSDSQEYFNLIAANYTITVTDANNCSQQINQVITNPIDLEATINGVIPNSCGVTDPNEFGLDFVVSNNYAPYTLEFSVDNGATWSTNQQYRGYTSGTIVKPMLRLLETDGVTVRCIKPLEDFKIPFELSNLIISTSTSGNCADGFQVTVEAQDGVGPYEFAINSTTNWVQPDVVNGNTRVFSNLTPGLSYQFYVKDAIGCVKENSVDVYDQFTPEITIDATVNNDACATADTGEITFEVNDPNNLISGSLSWQLFEASNPTIVVQNGTQSNTNPITVSNLPAGTFFIVITNNACSWGSRDTIVDRGTEIFGNPVVTRDITCNLPGIITINNLSGGFGNYEFTLTSSNFVNPIVTQNTSVEIPISNLNNSTIASTINVVVNDGSSCTKDLGNVVVNVSQQPEILSVTKDECDFNKSITVTGTNGTLPYFYSIDGGVSYQNSNIFNNLTAGNYTVKIIDANGCESSTQPMVIYPSLVFETSITKKLDCTINPDATVEVNVSSGSGNYEVEVKNSANTVAIARQAITGNTIQLALATADTYAITVFDVNSNCEMTLPVSISESEQPTFTYTTENSTCFGSNSGIIKLTNTNSALNYTYSIAPVSGTFNSAANSFTNLAAGNYTITATADNSCVVEQVNVTIDEFNPIAIPAPIVTDYTCTTGNLSTNAIITIDVANITGGSGNYSKIEFVNNQNTADLNDDVVVQTGASNTFILPNKNGGNFIITVFDDKGCIGTTTVNINPFVELTDINVALDKEEDCNTGANITVTVNAEAQAANKSFTISDNNGFSLTNTTGIFTDIASGNYTIQVTNLDTNCTLTSTYVVEAQPTFEVVATKTNDITCLGTSSGSVDFQFATTTPYNGTFSYILFNNSTNTATSINGNGSGLASINNLSAGEYFVRVTQTQNPFCVTDSNVFSIEAPSNTLDFTTTQAPISCDVTTSGELTVNAFGGWQLYQYKLETTSGTLIRDYTNNNIFTDFTANSYVVSVKDALNCEISKTVVFENPNPIVANTISSTPLTCFNDANASITISNVTGGQGNPVNYFYQIQKDGGQLSAKQSSNVFANLAAGNYTVIISDEYNCASNYDVAIVNPSPILVSTTITSNISCAVNTSTVSVSATGGSGSYSYSRDGINFSANNNFDVVSGEHQFYVRDTNGCSSEASTLVTIDGLVPLAATLDTSAALVNCTSENNAVLRAIATGGFGNYEYELLNNADAILRSRQTSDTFNDLSAGTYKIRVYSEDCTYTTESYTITEPEPLTFTAASQVNNISCFGANDGTITINATGGTGNLSYSIDQVKYTESNIFRNLSAGVYNIIVQDESGCFITETVTVNEPETLTASIINVNQELCAGNANASFAVAVSGGTAPFKTSLNGAPYIENQLSFNNLEGGKTYVVFIEDAAGCETFVNVTLDNPVTVNLSLNSTVNCTNYLSTIEAIVNDEVKADVLFSLNNGTPQASNLFENLANGTYTLTAIHTNGCEVSEQVIINNPNELILEGVTVSDILCFGGNTGQLAVTASGGQGNLLYSIDGTNFQTSNIFTGLSAGNYQVTVKDELNCTRLSAQTTVGQPNELTVALGTITQESCVNQNDGSFELTVSGGTVPYRTSIDGAAFVENQLSFTNLEGGKTYSVAIEDANGCTTATQVTLDAAIEIQLSSTTTLNCTNYLSTIEATVNNEVKADVLFSLNNGTPQSSNMFENLASGTYTLTAIHTNGCEVSEQVIINNPEPLVVNTVEAKDILCFGTNSGSITINTSGGNGNNQYSLDGINYQSINIFENLSKGNYTVWVKDDLNCSITSQSITIDEIEELKVSLVTVSQPKCDSEATGSFEINISGGTAPYKTKLNDGVFTSNKLIYNDLVGGNKYTVHVVDANNCETSFDINLEKGVDLELTLMPEYGCEGNATLFALVDDFYEGKVTYTINGDNPQKEGIFDNLPKGEYTIVATHENGCSATKTISIDENVELALTIDDSVQNQLIANATGGQPPYTYSIDNSDFVYDNVFNITESRFYTITVKDAKGCKKSVKIEGVFIDIVIPNFFTPNGNGKHDTWYPKKVKDYHNIEVLIYDRYSRLLKTFRGVNNSWDGIYNNKPLPSGDYWYVIYYDQTPGKRRKLMGNFTLYR